MPKKKSELSLVAEAAAAVVTDDVASGRELAQVDEPPYSGSTTLIFELEAYPEPKSLEPADLEALYFKLGTNKKVAAHIGASTNLVRAKRSEQV